MPSLVPPVDYPHVFWRNLLNLAAALPLAMCAEAPAMADGMEALDRAHPFPVYRSTAWKRMIEAGGQLKSAMMASLIARRKIAQWRAAPEDLTIFAGMDASMEFLRRLPHRFNYGIILLDHEIERLMAKMDRPARGPRTLRRAALLMGFHPAVAELGRRLGLPEHRCHALPHFIDLALFKPHVQTEGVMRQFRLSGRAAVAVWTPAGQTGALAPLIDAWVKGGSALRDKATLLVGFESAADGEGFAAWATERLGADKLPPWLRGAGEVPPNHLPYYFNVAALAAHVPARPERRVFAGWEIAAAAACGCPTVAPPEGLHTQFITPATGTLAALDSSDGILSFLNEHSGWLEPAESPAQAARRDACRAFVLDHFSPDRFKAALADALSSFTPHQIHR